MNLSPITLDILATEKIILVATMIVVFFLIVKRTRKPLYFSAVLAVSLATFSLVLLTPQSTMFWGNNGDELYIGSFMTQVVNGDFGSDFYYSNLPAFYPPLYFWVVGFIAQPFASNGLAAYKIGVVLSSLVLFLGTFLWFKLHDKKSRDALLNPWLYLLIPLSFLTLLPFDEFILKPHEALSALLSVILVGAIGVQFQKERWRIYHVVLYSISGAAILMTYYFWGVLIAPTLLMLIYLSRNKLHNSIHLLQLGALILLLASPYIIPLFQSIQTHGIDLAQGTYFSIHDVLTFTPWTDGGLRALFSFAGLAGLIVARKNRFFLSVLILYVVSYLYQTLGLMQFLQDASPLLPSKPFLYLGRACLAVGLGYVVLESYYYISHRFGRSAQFSGIALGIVLITSLSPYVDLIDNPGMIDRINQNTLVPKEFILAEEIKTHVPDYTDRIWLAPTRPEINTYLPLNYYIAHNEHYSHFAAGFSDRLETIEMMASSTTAGEFFEIAQAVEPPIDSLLLFYDEERDVYPLNFWIDDYPNGGTSYTIDLNPELIDETHWNTLYDEWNWRILTIDKLGD